MCITDIDNSLDHEQLYENCRIKDVPQQALHINWGGLATTFNKLLSGLLNREIDAEPDREEYYYWRISLHNSPLAQVELETLLGLSGADELDREQNDYGEYPVMELCQSLCVKLVSKILPFVPMLTLADDGGVWFISSCADNDGRSRIIQPLPDGSALIAERWDEPDYPGIRISLRNPGEREELICFAEYNSTKTTGKELSIAVYALGQDDPVYYESYSEQQAPSPNN